MDNRIDLSKYNIRSDLIIDMVDDEKLIKAKKSKKDDVIVSSIELKENELEGKKKGTYITIEFTDITNYEDREKIGEVFTKELKKMLKKIKIEDNDECLIIGLGNEKSTADALGPNVVNKVLITRHLFELNTNHKEGLRSVSAFSPDVMGNTGIETSDIILSLVKEIKPKFIVIIDSLASSSINRLNKTIQMTDSGIHPGSGIGNYRKEISSDLLGIPVIAIGVPTVVNSAIIVRDTIDYLIKHISYLKNNYSKSKLTYTKIDDYKSKISDSNLTEEEKKEILGMIGELSDSETYQLITEVLDSINYNLIVTNTEIDFLINKLSEVIANSLNNSLHRQISHY